MMRDEGNPTRGGEQTARAKGIEIFKGMIPNQSLRDRALMRDVARGIWQILAYI
jgi:hypothetical protein